MPMLLLLLLRHRLRNRDTPPPLGLRLRLRASLPTRLVRPGTGPPKRRSRPNRFLRLVVLLLPAEEGMPRLPSNRERRTLLLTKPVDSVRNHRMGTRRRLPDDHHDHQESFASLRSLLLSSARLNTKAGVDQLEYTLSC